jgi:hypothetical protein
VVTGRHFTIGFAELRDSDNYMSGWR